MPLIKSSFLFLLFFLSFFFIGSQTSLSQNITAQIGAYNSSNCQPGDTISIPVSVTTATGIGVSAISLAIEYDTTKLECLNYVTGLNQALSSAFISNCGSFNNLGASYTQSGRQFRVSWFQLNPVQLNGLAFNMNFRVLSQGNSSLTWDLQTPEVCGFYNDLAEEINQVTYQSGGVQCQYNPFSLQTQLVNLGTCSTLVGDTLDVPVILQNYSGVGITSISMAVDYDSTKLRCLPNVIGLQSTLNQNFISNSAWFNNLGPQANTAGSQFRAAWYQLNPVTLSDTLFKIRFVVKEPGTHAINFDLQTPGNCEYSDLNASVIPNTHWVNGSATASSLPQNLFQSDTLFVCGQSTTLMTPSGLGSYTWNTGDSTNAIIVRNSGWYRCEISNGLCISEDSVFVSILPNNFLDTDTVVCQGSSLTISTNQGYILDTTIGGYWPLRSNTIDYSSFNNHAIQNNFSSTLFADGLYFDGIDDHLSISAEKNQNCSFSFWFKTNNSGGERMFFNAGPNGNGPDLLLSCGQLNWNVWDGCNNPLSAIPNNYADGQYHHILLTNHIVDGSKLFYDGILIGTASYRNAGLTNLLYLAGAGNYGDYCWNGYMSDFTLFKKALSPSEVQFIHNRGRVLFTNLSYLWSTGDTTASITVSPTQTTTYHVTISNGIHSCVDSVTVNVIPNTLNPNIFAVDSLFHCGDSLVLDAGTGYSRYEWSSGDTTQTKTVSFTGWHKVRVYNGLCSVEDSVFVSLISVSISDSSFSCHGANTELSIFNEYNGSLYFNGNNQFASNNSSWISRDNFSIEVYAKPNSNNGTGFLISPAYGGLNDCGVGIQLNNNSISIVEHAPYYIPTVLSYNFNQPIEDFIHILLVYSNRNPHLYINGNLVASGNNASIHQAYGIQHVFVGFSDPPGTHIGGLGGNAMYGCFNGWVSKLTIRDFAATSVEASNIYNSHLGGIKDNNYKEYYIFKYGSPYIKAEVDSNNSLFFSSSAPAWYDILSNNNLSCLWSTGDTTSTITVSPTQTTTYYVTVSNGIHSCVDSVNVRVSPKIFVPDMAVCQGDTIDVPVIASQLDSVAAISLALNYNQQAMTYVGYTRLRPDMVSTSSIGTAAGQVRLGWFGLSPLVSGGLDTLVCYRFIVNQPGGISWNTQVLGDCELANLNLDILDYCFEGGQIRLLDTVSILSSSQGPWGVQVGDSIQLNVQSTGTLTNQWQRWNAQLGQWENLQDNGVYRGTSTPTLTFHCNSYQRPFPKFRLELTNGCRPSYGPEMPVTILQNIHVSIGQSTTCQGDTLDIPVLISGAREIGAVSLVLNFNTGSVQFLDWVNAAPQTGTNPWFVNQVGNEIRLAWFSLQSANIPDGQPLGILRVIGMGTTSLNWDLLTPGNCEFGDEEATTIPANFTPGFLSVNPKPVVQLQATASAICPNGGTTTLSTIFDPSYTYQWFLNGQPLSTSQTSTLTTGQSGPYQVLITTSLGCSQWSSVETIANHPLPNPVITVIGSATTCDQPVTLNVNATQGNSLEFWWHLNGAPLSNSPGTQWIATQSGDYSVYAMDLNTQCIAWSSAVTVTIHSLPTATVSYNGSTTFCLGDSLALVANSGSGFVYQWTRNGQILAGSTNQNYMAYMGGDYAVTVTNAQGCSSTSSTIFLSTQNCNQVTGRLSYNNALNTALRNTKVYFQDSIGLPLDSTITNLAGDFSFSGFINGTYKIKSAPSLTWGGVNATDALGVVRHYTNYVLLQGFRLKAADVNGSNNVNNTDALLITRRYSNLVPQFNVGPWLSENPTVHANGYPIVSNLQALCYGDVNGSYNPIQTRIAPRVNLEEYGTIHPSGKCYKLPIYALENQEIGAISLAMVLPKGVVVKDVHSKINHGTMDFGQWEDELRIAWFSPNQFNANAGDVLFVLEVCSDMDSMSWGPTDLEVRGLSELADFWANPYDFARLGLPSVKSRSVSGDELVVWPNPAQGNTYVRWTFNEPTTLSSIRVLDAVGKEVYSEQFGWAGTGAKDLVLPSSEWAEGIYAIQAQWTTSSGHTKTKSLLLRRK
jgi:hypothetical protein